MHHLSRENGLQIFKKTPFITFRFFKAIKHTKNTNQIFFTKDKTFKKG